MKLILLFIVLTIQLVASTEFEEAYEIYKKGDYKQSLLLFKDLAKETKDSDAAYILGYMYEHGEGCEVNKEEATKWYKFSSKSYYHQIKHDATRDLDKEQRKIYRSMDRVDDEDAQDTIRQYTQALYNLKAHNTNYFLPVSYKYGGDYADTYDHTAKNIETEFQVSIKFDFAANIFNLGEIYTVAYTQKAFWQLYAESAYFRETNYNPELFVTLPIDTSMLKALRVSFEHQSNGRGGDEERSWDYLSSTFFFQYKHLFTELKLWYRTDTHYKNYDYNPELLDYIGNGYVKFIVPYKKHLFKLMLRHNLSDYGAVEVNYSYPLFSKDDLFFYVKTFNGYGESLIDYNNKIDKIGIGFSISR